MAPDAPVAASSPSLISHFLLQAGEQCFWGSTSQEELPAPEFVALGISAQLRSEETSRSLRAGNLLGLATSKGLLRLGPEEGSGATSTSHGPPAQDGGSGRGGLLVRQASLASAPTLSSLPEDGSAHFSNPSGDSILAKMVAAADTRAERHEMEVLQQMTVAAADEGRQRGRSRPELGATSDGGAGPVYMAERGDSTVADGRTSPPLHQAVRLLERKVHGRSFVRSFSNSSSGGSTPSNSFNSRSAADLAGAAGGFSSSTPAPLLSRAHSCPAPPTPGERQAELASQIDRLLGYRMHKVVPLQRQQPGSAVNLQAWLSTSSHVSMMGDLMDPSQQALRRQSLELPSSSSLQQQSLLPAHTLLASELPSHVAAAATAISAFAPAAMAAPLQGTQASSLVPAQPPSHFQLQLMRFSSGSSVCLQPPELQGSLQPPLEAPAPVLQSAQSGVSSGGMRLLELAEMSASCTITGEGNSEGLASGPDEAAAALDAAASVATSSMRGRGNNGSSGGGAMPLARGRGLQHSASMHSMSSAGSGTARSGLAGLGRRLSWGTTMAGARSMLAGLKARGGSSQQLLSLAPEPEQAATVPLPARRTRGGQLLRSLSPASPSTHEAQLGSLLAQESVLNSSSIPEGATLVMPPALADLDVEALSKQYGDVPEPAVRGGRIKRNGSSAAISTASGASSRAGSISDPSDLVGSPLQRFLLGGSHGGTNGAGCSMDGSLGLTRSMPSPAPPIAIQRRQRRASLPELVAAGELALDSELDGGEHCVRGGLTAWARSASQVCSYSSSMLAGSLGSPPGPFAQTSTLEDAAAALGWQSSQGGRGAEGQQLGHDVQAQQCQEQPRPSLGGSIAEGHHSRLQTSRNHSFDSAATCVTINGEALALGGGLHTGRGLHPPASASDATADSSAAAGAAPGPSVLKLSGLMYSYPHGPLSPTSSHTGQMGPGSFWHEK
jgi:hypothetical protein